MKATKFLLLLWALALGSTVGWAQTVSDVSLTMTPGPNATTDIAVCPGGGNVTLNWKGTGTAATAEIRASSLDGISIGPLVAGPFALGVPSGAIQSATIGIPAGLVLDKRYFIVVNVVNNNPPAATAHVTFIPTALPTVDFTLTPSTVCVQPGNASIATAVLPDTDKFSYEWSLVEGTPSTVSTFAPSTGTSTTITPTAAFGSAEITLTAKYRSMPGVCTITPKTRTLTTVAAIVPKINSNPGAPAGITVYSPASIFNGDTLAAPYATFPTVPVANKEVCEGTQITFSAYCIAGQTAVWSRNGVQIGTGSPITVTPVSGVNDPAYNEFTYTVRCKLNGSINCESEGRSITVKTIRQSSLLTGTPSVVEPSICPSTAGNPTTTTFMASVNCPSGSTAQWYDASSGGSPVTTGSSRTHTGVSIVNNTQLPITYTWYVTCKQGLCESASRTAYTFTVKAKPGTPDITNTNGLVTCKNSPLILTALCAPGTTANWYTNPTSNPLENIIGTGGSYTHISAVAGTTTYRVRCQADNPDKCWSELSSDDVMVEPQAVVTTNEIAAQPTGDLTWNVSPTDADGTKKICINTTPGSTFAVTNNINCATTTTAPKWYKDNVLLAGAPTALSITAVTTHTYEVSCDDAFSDPGVAGKYCESPRITVSVSVVAPPVKPVLTLAGSSADGNLDETTANVVICQGPNNTTTITSNCPVGVNWTTQWQIEGTGIVKGIADAQGDWTVNPAQTDASTNILYVNSVNFDPSFVSAANGWTIRARCHNELNPGSPTPTPPGVCENGAITTVTGVKVNVKEAAQNFFMQAPVGTNIPSGKDLCLSSSVKLIQVEPIMPSGICTGIIQWQRRFRTQIGSSDPTTWGAWGGSTTGQGNTPVIGENSPFTDTPAAVGEYEYRVRCYGFCPGDWSTAQSVAIYKAPTPTATLTPTTVACQAAGASTTITLALSGCDNSTGVTNSTYVIERTVKNGSNAAVTTSNYATTTVSGNWTEVVNASMSYSTDIVYTYVVRCQQTYDVALNGGQVTCTSDPAAEQKITIRTKPAVPTALSVDATPICKTTGIANLKGTCAEGFIKWKKVGTSTLIANNAVVNGDSVLQVTNLQSSVSYVAICKVGTCESDDAPTQVSVSVIDPVKPVLSQTTPVLCPTPSIAPSVKTTTLTATGCSGAQENIVWYKYNSMTDSTNVGSGAGSGMNYALTVTTGTPGVGQVGISSTGGEYIFKAFCTRPGSCISKESITVTVLPDPGLSITKLPASNPVCAGTAVTLSATSVLSPIGGWSWTGSGTLVTVANQNDPSIVTPGSGATAAMSGTYGLTANYQSCVFQAAPVTLTVVTSITAPTAIVGPTTDQCQAVSATANLSTTCPTSGSTPVWSTGETTTSIAAAVPASGSAIYSVKCVLGACESSSVSFTINTKPFQVTILDVKGSGVSTIAAMKSVYPFDASTYAGATHVGQLDLDKTTAVNRLGLQNYKTPRFWTLEAKLCAANPDVKSLTFRADKLDAVDNVEAQFYTTEDNDRYFMFGNGGNTPADQVYTINHPYFAFYNGGLYDAGFPKGKYNIKIDAWMVAGDTQGGTLLSNVQKIAPWNPAHMSAPQMPIAGLSRTYYIDITTTDGSARVGVDSEEAFAVVTPNPVTRTLTLSINGAKGQNVSLNLVDASGRSLMTRSVTPESNSHREEVDMSNNKTGMYFMQVSSPLKSAALKVLKVSQD